MINKLLPLFPTMQYFINKVLFKFIIMNHHLVIPVNLSNSITELY